MSNSNKKAQLVNKKLHEICEDDATYSVPLGLTKKGDEVAVLEKTTITIEYAPEKNFTLEFTVDKLKTCTTMELFTIALERLIDLIEHKGLTDIEVETIVSLETKKRSLLLDYYLTIPNKTIEFLQGDVELAFYHRTRVAGVLESPIESRISLNDFEVIAKLGSGGFATVYLGKDSLSNCKLTLFFCFSSAMEKEWKILFLEANI